MAGAPIGNQNAAKGRRMARILEGLCAEDEYKLLREGLRKQLETFAKGEVKSGEFVRDTMDGKPVQPIAGDPDGTPLVVQVIRYTDADDKPAE